MGLSVSLGAGRRQSFQQIGRVSYAQTHVRYAQTRVFGLRFPADPRFLRRSPLAAVSRCMCLTVRQKRAAKMVTIRNPFLQNRVLFVISKPLELVSYLDSLVRWRQTLSY